MPAKRTSASLRKSWRIAASVGLSIVLGGWFSTLASRWTSSASAGELRARMIAWENLGARGTSSASGASATSERFRYTLRVPDPLVPEKFQGMRVNADKDITLAIYAPGSKISHTFGEVVVRLAGGRAVPATVVVPAGIAISFRNDDPFLHHLVAPQVDRDLRPGETHKYEPKGKGVVKFTDTLISSVQAWIVVDDGVVANRWATPDGIVKLTELAAGEYVLKTYFEGTLRTTTPFKIAGTASTELKEPIALGPVSSSSVK